jgi:thiamine kinase-like enzyme
LEQLLGKEWEITPAGGATGDAYFAEYEGKKLFLKRNSSPFLAVLSAEGIVPKLVWTKRMENGDVFTAQQWKRTGGGVVAENSWLQRAGDDA